MNKSFFADGFAAFCAAQYGVADPADMPVRQRLEIEDAYFSGATIGFCHGFGCDNDEARAAHAELRDFADRIDSRYEAAGIPTVARRP